MVIFRFITAVLPYHPLPSPPANAKTRTWPASTPAPPLDIAPAQDTKYKIQTLL